MLCKGLVAAKGVVTGFSSAFLVRSPGGETAGLHGTFLFFIIFHLSLFFTGCGKLDTIFDFEPPAVKSISPADRSQQIPLTPQITVLFSEEIARETVEENLSFSRDDRSVAYTWSLKGDLLTILPKEKLKKDSLYSITLGRGIRDLQGNKMVLSHVSRFQTGADAGSFQIVTNYPALYYYGFEKPRPVISAGANMPVAADQETASLVTLSPSVFGSTLIRSNRVLFKLHSDLEKNTAYTVTIAAKLSGTNGSALLENKTWTFYTGYHAPQPSLTGIYPPERAILPPASRYYTNGGKDLRSKTNLIFAFSDDMDQKSVEQALVISPSVSGYCHWESGDLLIFKPYEPLVRDVWYTIGVGKSALSAAGVPLEEEKRYTLKTASAVDAPLVMDKITISSLGLSVELTNEITVIAISNETALNFEVSFQLGSDEDLYQPSVYDNIRFSYILGAHDLKGLISGMDINESNDTEGIVTVHLASLGVSNYYQILVKGGENGIATTDQRFLEKDHEYVIKLVK